VTSEIVHWMLYLLVLLTTLSGWLFASARGWNVSWFFVAPLPMLTSGDRALTRTLNGWHQNLMWALLILVGVHVAAALVHLLYHRDRVMQRMLPGGSSVTVGADEPVR
jgi:cytochrome b561